MDAFTVQVAGGFARCTLHSATNMAWRSPSLGKVKANKSLVDHSVLLVMHPLVNHIWNTMKLYETIETSNVFSFTPSPYYLLMNLPANSISTGPAIQLAYSQVLWVSILGRCTHLAIRLCTTHELVQKFKKRYERQAKEAGSSMNEL